MERRPPRSMGPLDAHFWAFCDRGEFRLQECADCRRTLWPPTPVCDSCLGDDLAWTQMSGLGSLKTYCVFERQYYPELATPWPVLLVELAEGPWFISNPKDVPLDELRPGLELQVAFLDCEDEHGQFRLPVFEPLRER